MDELVKYKNKVLKMTEEALTKELTKEQRAEFERLRVTADTNFVQSVPNPKVLELPADHEDQHLEMVRKRKLTAHVKPRRLAYPDFGQFAEMYFEVVTKRIEAGEVLSPLEQIWYDKCAAIKVAIPKPTTQGA